MSSKRVFISRFLKPDSIFSQRLVAAGLEVIGESLIDFEAVVFDSIPTVDWIFFYSGTGVHFFFEQLEKQQLILSEGIQFAALGSGTADKFPASYTANFIGQGKPEAVATQFLAVAYGKQVLFPRAATSRQSIQQFLKSEIQSEDLIVYKNTPKKNIDLPDCDCLVLTSPMNATVYFSQKAFQTHQKVIAIGQTTASALEKLGITRFQIAENSTEEALVEAVLAATV